MCLSWLHGILVTVLDLAETVIGTMGVTVDTEVPVEVAVELPIGLEGQAATSTAGVRLVTFLSLVPTLLPLITQHTRIYLINFSR